MLTPPLNQEGKHETKTHDTFVNARAVGTLDTAGQCRESVCITTGNEYRLIDAIHEVAQAPGDGDAASSFFNVRANFIDTGPDGSHSQLNNTFRMVVVDGVPQVSLFSSTLECRGPA